MATKLILVICKRGLPLTVPPVSARMPELTATARQGQGSTAGSHWPAHSAHGAASVMEQSPQPSQHPLTGTEHPCCLLLLTRHKISNSVHQRALAHVPGACISSILTDVACLRHGRIRDQNQYRAISSTCLTPVVIFAPTRPAEAPHRQEAD